MPDSKRLFLGFSLESAEITALRGLQQKLGSCAGTDAGTVAGTGAGKDVPPGNLHMTLAFLGQTNSDQEAALRDEITGLSRPGFSQRLDTLVHWRGAGVVCLWGKAEDSALIGMFEASQAIAAKLGLHQSEHRFNPHITLKRKAKVFQKPEWTPAPLTLTPDALHLYHSQSTAFGVQYQILQSWPLAD